MDNLLYENDKKVNVRILCRAQGGWHPRSPHRGSSLAVPSPAAGAGSIPAPSKLSVVRESFAAQVKVERSNSLETAFGFPLSNAVLAPLTARVRTQKKKFSAQGRGQYF